MMDENINRIGQLWENRKKKIDPIRNNINNVGVCNKLIVSYNDLVNSM